MINVYWNHWRQNTISVIYQGQKETIVQISSSGSLSLLTVKANTGLKKHFISNKTFTLPLLELTYFSIQYVFIEY